MTVAAAGRRMPRPDGLARWLAWICCGLGLGLAAAASPKLAIGAVLGCGFVALTVSRLSYGLAGFTVLTFFSSITGGGDLTVVKLAGLVVAGVALVRVLERHGAGNLFRDVPAAAWAAIGLTVWAFASRAWAESPGTAQSNALRLAQGAVLVFAICAGVRTVRDLRVMLWAFAAGAAVTAVYGLATGATNPNAVDRLSGGIGDPNELAAALVPALGMTAFLLATASSRRERLLAVLCLVAICPTLFLTQSRGGLVALAAMIVAGLVFGGRYRPHVVALALVVSAVGIGYFALFSSAASQSRISSLGSGTGRTDLWNIALRMFENHPLAGIGMGNFPLGSAAYTPAPVNLPRFDLILFTPEPTHNTYLQVLAELGVVGVVLIALLVFASLRSGVRATRRLVAVDSEGELLGRATVIAAIGALTAYTFFSAQFEKQLWIVLGLLVSLPAVAHHARTRTRTPAGQPPA